MSEEQRKTLFNRVTTFLKESRGIQYKHQADEINKITRSMPLHRMKNIRSMDGSPYPYESEIQALFTAFADELDGIDFSQKPISITRVEREKRELEEELEKLQQVADLLRKQLDKEQQEKSNLLKTIDTLSRTIDKLTN